MDPDFKETRTPSPTDNGEPDNLFESTTLLLKGQSIVSDTAAETPLYEMGLDVTALLQKSTSATFTRVENDIPLKADDEASIEQQTQQLFYLAHPAGAQFQTETPAYYITSVSPEMPGNISLETTKSRFQKPEFKAFLSSNKSWSDSPLFDADPKLLFEAKPRWMSGRYTWTDADNKEIAYDDEKGDDHRLVTTVSMPKPIRDTLVAAWCLRLWHNTAESKRAKYEYMGSMADPESLRVYCDSRMARRTRAAGALAVLGV